MVKRDPDYPIDPEIKTLLRQRVFTDRPDGPCEYCGGYHLRKPCPRVKRQAFHPNGNLIEVEYWQAGEYDESDTIYPEDVYDQEDEGA